MPRIDGIGGRMALDVPATSSNEGTDLVRSFGDVLEQALDTVNDMQSRADRLTEKLAAGEVNDIHQVMIAVEQVNLALQLTMQVRNKVIESYQEVMRMQI